MCVCVGIVAYLGKLHISQEMFSPLFSKVQYLHDQLTELFVSVLTGLEEVAPNDDDDGTEYEEPAEVDAPNGKSKTTNFD